MKIIEPSAEIIAATENLEQLLELAGRVCYKSEDRITPDSASEFIGRMHASKHESVLEHGAITVRFICDRGVSHELVRHRIASFSQESTRYCNYSKDKFGGEIAFADLATGFRADIVKEPELYHEWKLAMEDAERHYLSMIELGASPQMARSVLPNSLKTEVMMTANPREWVHVFRLRCSEKAHPQMREVMIPLRDEFVRRWPSIFKTI